MKINVKEVNMSIWLLLPVAIITAAVVAIFNGGFSTQLFSLAFAILTFGAIIWIPSMLFTMAIEYLFISESSTSTTVAVLFGIETAITFVVISFLFGGLSSGIPFLALVMSVATQVCRWIYLQRKNRLYEGRVISADENLVDM